MGEFERKLSQKKLSLGQELPDKKTKQKGMNPLEDPADLTRKWKSNNKLQLKESKTTRNK